MDRCYSCHSEKYLISLRANNLENKLDTKVCLKCIDSSLYDIFGENYFRVMKKVREIGYEELRISQARIELEVEIEKSMEDLEEIFVDKFTGRD